ncbi:MAG: hypothetical protein EA339_05825 [Rhodobacteraceae bacterium]|nr:MAG: hypothetical protein EA339_05825 [Paracoccaceae bacterium]
MGETDRTIAAGPRLSPAEERLLLLLSRPALTPEQTATAFELCAQVTQWPLLITTSYRKFVLPMVLGNLSGLPPDAMQENLRKSMRTMSRTITSMTLQRLAAFDWFHAHCVLPAGVEYAYFKGPALASHLYPDPCARFFRDVDILVAAQDRLNLLRRARDLGCKLYGHAWADATELSLVDDTALEDFLFINSVPHIMTPQGLLVEMHTEIDYHTSLFDTRALLRGSMDVTIRGQPVRMLSDTEHFVFICYHHTRHMWSKLHWIADLDAFCNAPGFDRTAALALGRRLRIETTISAALELHDLASQGRHPSEFDRLTPGADLLQACLETLGGDLELETALRRRRKQRAFALGFDWQPTPVSHWHRVWLRLRKIKVSYAVFRRIPGGRNWRHLRYGCALGIRVMTDGPRALRAALGRRA